jgi:hypothetical protein
MRSKMRRRKRRRRNRRTAALRTSSVWRLSRLCLVCAVRYEARTHLSSSHFNSFFYRTSKTPAHTLLLCAGFLCVPHSAVNSSTQLASALSEWREEHSVGCTHATDRVSGSCDRLQSPLRPVSFCAHLHFHCSLCLSLCFSHSFHLQTALMAADKVVVAVVVVVAVCCDKLGHRLAQASVERQLRGVGAVAYSERELSGDMYKMSLRSVQNENVALLAQAYGTVTCRFHVMRVCDVLTWRDVVRWCGVQVAVVTSTLRRVSSNNRCSISGESNLNPPPPLNPSSLPNPTQSTPLCLFAAY